MSAPVFEVGASVAVISMEWSGNVRAEVVHAVSKVVRSAKRIRLANGDKFSTSAYSPNEWQGYGDTRRSRTIRAATAADVESVKAAKEKAEREVAETRRKNEIALKMREARWWDMPLATLEAVARILDGGS